MGLEPTTHGLKEGERDLGPLRLRSETLGSVDVSHHGVSAAVASVWSVSAAKWGKGGASEAGTEPDDLLSVRAVAKRLGVCTRTVYEIVDRGQIRHVRLGNVIRIAPTDLAGFISRHIAGANGRNRER